ncbi:hypothetical protein [Isoptericola aurantiacus]|uniref:hypothetical protein n=1 Tax=Isoptericola aurantiacus TaxID=3377839 RepID=UPI00383A49FB
MSWEPLAAANPVPGDPDVSTSAATYYGEVAAAMDDAWAALGVIEETDGFTSDAVDALREKTDDVRAELQKASTRYSAVATALSTYAVAHRQAQDDAAALLTRAQEAQGALDEAEQAVTTAQGNYDDAVTTARTTGEPVDSAATWMLRTQVSTRDTARTSLSLTVGELDGIVSTWRAAARAAAGDIREGVKASDLNDGWWEKWGSDLASFVSKWAGKIAMWAGIAALVLGWVPILGQILAVVALVATVVALVADIALVLHGEGDWVNVLLGVVAVATFGVGRGAGAAFKATGARGVAQGAARQTRLTQNISRFGSPQTRNVVRSTWSRATSGFRSADVRWNNPVTWFQQGVRSFSGLRGRAWIMNFMGHSDAARSFQALSNANGVRQFAQGATAYPATLHRLGSLNPLAVGSLGTVVAPYVSDVVGNGTLLYRDQKTW